MENNRTQKADAAVLVAYQKAATIVRRYRSALTRFGTTKAAADKRAVNKYAAQYAAASAEYDHLFQRAWEIGVEERQAYYSHS